MTLELTKGEIWLGMETQEDMLRLAVRGVRPKARKTIPVISQTIERKPDEQAARADPRAAATKIKGAKAPFLNRSLGQKHIQV